MRRVDPRRVTGEIAGLGLRETRGGRQEVACQKTGTGGVILEHRQKLRDRSLCEGTRKFHRIREMENDQDEEKSGYKG